MKKILFVVNTMGRAGAEMALIELLYQLGGNDYELYLYVVMGQGELIDRVPPYDKRADAYFNAACSLGIGEDQRKEIMRCLQLGRVRSDWKGDLRDIKEKIKEAKYASDRNYWICMKKLL